MAEIALEHISKRYGDGFEAVKDMNLDVADGEFMILVGPSGCGKTTALRMVAGLEEVTDGELVIGGEVVTHLEPRKRDIAMVFQNYALYPHMTVRDNMAFSLKLARCSRQEIEQKVNDAAAIAQFPGASQFTQPIGDIAAAAVVVTIPVMILVLLFQRRIVSGLTAGAVKG